MARKSATSADAFQFGATKAERMENIGKIIDSVGKAIDGDSPVGTYKGKHRIKGARAVIPISTGSMGVDLILGVGGLPLARVAEIYGPEASGKTTFCLMCAAEVQKLGGLACFVDAEHALDLEYAGKLGVLTDELLIMQPDCGEDALEAVEVFVRGGANLVIVDSVAALVPKAEIDGNMGQSHPGAQARLMSQAMRKLTSAVAMSKCTVIFINQIRMKIGVSFGSPKTTSGGEALKFYSSVRLEIRRIGSVKKGEDAIGNRVQVKVVKNKVAPPFKKCEFDLIFGKGIDQAREALDYGLNLGVFKKSGSWYSVVNGKETTRMGQGREVAVQYIERNPDVVQKVRAALAASINNDG